MGKSDVVLYNFLEDRERFADLYNGGWFGGQRIILPGELRELDGRYVDFPAQAKGNKAESKSRMRGRDIKKLYRDQAVLRILAVENQMEVDYTMPWRCMNYDAREYERQIRKLRKKNEESGDLRPGAEFLCGLKKEDRLIPVYTLCVYYGEDPWDGPRSLGDMMARDQTPSAWDRWFKDYPFHLICANEWTQKDVFRTSLKEVFDALPCRGDKERLRKVLRENPAYQKLDEDTFQTLAVLLGEKTMVPKKNEAEEGWNMCKALEDIRQEGIDIGIEKGMEKGMEKGVEQIVRNMLQKGLTDENIIALTECSQQTLEKVRSSI